MSITVLGEGEKVRIARLILREMREDGILVSYSPGFRGSDR